MEIKALYNIAKDYAQTLKNAKSGISGELCLILTDGKEMVTGVTGVRIANDAAEDVSAFENALAYCALTGKKRAEQILNISLADDSVVKLSDEMLGKLIKLDYENGKCEVAVSDSEFVLAGGKKDEAADLAAPADFSDGFDFDESNPFFEPKTGAAPEPSIAHPNTADPKFLYNQPGQANAQPGNVQTDVNGFTNPAVNQQPQQPMQGGYAPQQGGYPGQGFPQQGGYMPQQGGYPGQGYMPGQPANPNFAQQQRMSAQGYPQQTRSTYLGSGAVQTNNVGKSVVLPTVGDGKTSAYEASVMLSQSLGGSGGAFKKRFAAFADDEDNSDIDEILNEGKEEDDSNNATMSKDELKRRAAEQKKIAKQNAKEKSKM
ncbi:MAG: hypothetical protein II936_03420 [Oscillospiraceae bacterium]|nr:hypothetical protein [Oscillospiraceae bacterium]